MTKLWQKYQLHFETLFVLLLSAAVRLTSLNVFRAVDEEDRWAWAVDFYRALLAGDLSATLVGDGYPGIFPVWLETIWLFLASLYRSLLQGSWIGNDGVYLLIHQWARIENLGLQRFPVVLVNTVLVVVIFLYLRHLFGRWIALVAAILISLDPFYLSDSRVNRAEALVTGLMMISLLALIATLRINQIDTRHASRITHHASRFNFNKHLLISGIFGGLAWLTKSQALVLIPMFTVISLIWPLRSEAGWQTAVRRWLTTMTLWTVLAAITFAALWPAVWTVPGPTFTRMYTYVTRKVGEEGVKLFFLGSTALDEDPGWLFYPVIFILRATPLMLLGLLLGGWNLIRREWQRYNWRSWLDDAGLWALLAYALLYVGGMTLGSHKQDRFLMTAFPALNVLAAAGFVYFAQQISISRNLTARWTWVGLGGLLALQLATALPYHPYYFSYFNPLVGGGPIATRLTRVGWGEGMDQVGAYLQNLDDPESLTVATRFTHYLMTFKGTILNLDNDGEWVRADKIIFYIQQSQRNLDPSPGVIHYFQQHVPPEKTITINNIDYAQIFPNPIHFPADPQVDIIDNQMRLFGYRWQPGDDGSAIVHLIWENLSNADKTIGLRLWSTEAIHSDWIDCASRPAFEAATQQPGEVVESACKLANIEQPPGLYDLQVGLQQPGSSWQALDFAAGWSAVEVANNGRLHRIDPEQAFAQLATQAVPDSATPLEHTYFNHVRLLAFELTPNKPQPGQSIALTLYWQATRALERDADVSIQAFVADNQRIAHVNGTPLGGHSTRPTSSWQPGEVIQDVWQIDLPADIPAPALVRLDVGLFLPETLVPLPVRNLAGEDIPAAITKFRLEPDRWPKYRGDNPLNINFDNTIRLTGYDINPNGDLLNVTLYWEADKVPQESYIAFAHLLNAEGALIAQSDELPARGYFPTSAWQPGDVVLSRHQLALPAEIAFGDYQLVSGLYRPTDGTRLPALTANGQPIPNNAAPLGPISLP